MQYALTLLTKECTNSMKGLLILSMLWLHLFNHMDSCEGLSHLCYVGMEPFEHWISHGCASVVSFYLFISGYGMAYGYSKNVGYLNTKNNIRRVLKLYILYWLAVIVFKIIIGVGIMGGAISWSIGSLIGNITCYRPMWYSESWFIFPFAMIVLTCKYWFRITSKFKSFEVILSCIILATICSYLISRYYDSYFVYHDALYQIVLYLSCLTSFLTGSEFYKLSKRMIYLPVWIITGWGQLCVLLLFFAGFMLRCGINSAAISPFYLMYMVTIYRMIEIPKIIGTVLSFFGRYSTMMWLTHTYFCYYLFSDWIYSFQHPLLIFVVLLGLTIFCAIPMERIYTTIIKSLKFM